MSSIIIKTKRLENGCLIRVLISHPMETGRRQDKTSGETIPAHFIQHVNVKHNGKLVASGEFGTAVSRDPYLSFRLKHASTGDIVSVGWSDNLGQSDREETKIP